jgi:hypothetical protein
VGNHTGNFDVVCIGLCRCSPIRTLPADCYRKLNKQSLWESSIVWPTNLGSLLLARHWETLLNTPHQGHWQWTDRKATNADPQAVSERAIKVLFYSKEALLSHQAADTDTQHLNLPGAWRGHSQSSWTWCGC